MTADAAGDAFSGSAAGWGWVRSYALAWAAVFVLFAAQSVAMLHAYGSAMPPLLAAMTVTGWLIRAVVALPFFGWIRKHPIRSRADVLPHVAAMLLFTVVENSICSVFEQILPYLKHHTPAEVFAAESHLDLLTYAVLLGIVQAHAYRRDLRRRETEAHELALARARLETQLADARLAALRMQLQPHFLFNALHAISALIHTDPNTADSMLEQLSDLLRLVLRHDAASEVSLRAELDIVDRYLAIQKMRFGERLLVEQEVEPGSLDARVPALILQPLVENAVRHALERRAAAGRIVLRATANGESLELQVEDDGADASSAQKKESSGIGLANARARLQQLHGSAATLRLDRTDRGGTRVVVTMPWRSAEVPA